jgi:hypothetical protein
MFRGDDAMIEEKEEVALRSEGPLPGDIADGSEGVVGAIGLALLALGTVKIAGTSGNGRCHPRYRHIDDQGSWAAM